MVASTDKNRRAMIARTAIHVCQLVVRPSVWMVFARRISAREPEKRALMLANLVSSFGTSDEIITRSDELNSSVAVRVIGIDLLSYCSSSAGKHRHLCILLLAVQSLCCGKLMTFRP